MNLIFRLLRSVISLIIQAILNLAVTVIRLIVLPLVLAVLGILSSVIFFSFRATLHGPRRFIDRLAGEWTATIIQVVDDREHIEQVFQVCRIAAGTLIVIGWALITLFTVEFLRIVFGFFI